MYIKLNENKELMITKAEALYRGENLATTLIFLIPLKFGDLVTADSTLFMSYIRADGVPDISMLTKQEAMYNENYFQFIAPVDCKLTFAPGKAVVWLQAHCGDAVAKSGECVLWVRDTQDADGLCADEMYTAIYQIQSNLEEVSAAVKNKADGLIYDDKTRNLQLTSEGKLIDKVVVVPSDEFVEEEKGGEWSDMGSTDDDDAAKEFWEEM